jgi:hypothetical protein
MLRRGDQPRDRRRGLELQLLRVFLAQLADLLGLSRNPLATLSLGLLLSLQLGSALVLSLAADGVVGVRRREVLDKLVLRWPVNLLALINNPDAALAGRVLVGTWDG